MTLEERASKLSHPDIVLVLASNQALSEEKSELLAKNQSLHSRLQQVEAQVAWFKNQLFGQKSEKRKYLDPENRQLFLGEAFETEAEVTPEAVTIKEYQRRKSPKEELPGTPEDSGLRFEEGEVPLEEVELPCPELEGNNSEQYELVSTKASYKLAQKPGAYVVVKYLKRTVKHKETKKLITTPMPQSVLGNSVADVSLLAGMIIDKCLYHLPLYRQHQRLKDSRILLSRSSLTSMFHASVSLLEPIYESQFKSILSGSLVLMDETPMKGGRAEPGKMRDSYVWPVMGEQGEVCFVWNESRAHKYAKEILGPNFSGILLTDGYPAYARYAATNPEVLHAQCWNHSRRYFLKAEKEEPALVNIALDYIGKLYAIEQEIRDSNLEEEKKLLYRVLHSKPLVEQFFDWLQSVFTKQLLLPSNYFSKAADYVLEREQELKVFLRFPEVPLDTNDLERELRCIAVGRKNWNFAWTEIGAKYLCMAQSLLRSCLLQKVDPWKYLVDVLQRVDSHPISQVELLTPRLWKENFEDSRIKSVLETYSTKNVRWS